MRIKIGYDLLFDVPAPVSMMLMLYVHPSRGQAWTAALSQPGKEQSLWREIEVAMPNCRS